MALLERAGQAVLLYYATARSLRGQDTIGDPITVNPRKLNRVSWIFLPVFMLARLSSTEPAQKLETSLERDWLA